MPSPAQVLGLGALALVVSATLIANQATQPTELETDKLTGDLLSGLENAMDSSVDWHVKAAMAQPSPGLTASMSGGHKLLPYDPHPYVTQTQLDRLLAEKRELESKREAIVRTLRIRRQAAAAKAAKDAAALDRVRLERAVTAAKKRQMELAQQAARSAEHQMKEAAVAKQMAIHAAKVAEARQKELAYLSRVNQAQAEQTAYANDQMDSAEDMQYQQDKSEVDSKLEHYLSQERDLLHKIRTVEKVAKHGGAWPSEGLSPSAPQAMRSKAPQSLKQAKVESSVLSTLKQAVNQNRFRVEGDEKKAQALRAEYSKVMGNIQTLRRSDSRLKNEMVQAELKRV
mmetsp:Transcript_37737/g.58895  ORF Transcript_37737/g.58895 Transcript_37737/m.58895 type:complete len:342 (+) Transcript_37737:95-1120(+)|eukprot:CAMPEP_0184288210 /NCGR_PEP_ID=MMETSP1049-20130417/710_1 /TAXON_ID=77928 /ORGANISM="Proteomonas sulcata, Strain CCMP704" /LENGTH=341 /DNA_ID=CAMNT_0026594459 /DNA_START=53 /DNA_END=1078 /DNA_ORIENTATION=-